MSLFNDPFTPSEIEFELLTTLYGAYNLDAVVSVLAWDIIETFPDEITHIWSSRKKLDFITLMYVIARYGPFLINVILAALITQVAAGMLIEVTTLYYLYCVPWFVVLGCTEGLFIIRAVALNGNSRWLFYTLVSSFIVEIFSALISFVVLLQATRAPTRPLVLPFVRSRIPVVFPKLASIIPFAIPELVFQSILVTVIIVTIIKNRKAWTSRSQNSLTSIIIRDGLWGYFFNLFGLMVIFLSPIWLSGPAGQPNLQWSYVTFSVTSTRLLLNIRSGSEAPFVNDVSLSTFLPKFRSQVSSVFPREDDCEPQELELLARTEGYNGDEPADRIDRHNSL